MELEPLQLLTTILEQYSVSEPLRQGESKINASIDYSNQIAEQMNKHTKWLQFVGDEVIRKIATRPYFFNILDDMLHCDYLTSNTCCFVLGTDSPTDGRMKLFYIVDALPDGKEVDSINVYQLDSGLYALYTTEETITTLRDLILQNSQEIDSLKEMVESGGNSYTPDNPPPYPVTSVAGKTGAVALTKSDVGLASVDNVRQYSSSNPPPYPVTSVAGKTGAVALTKSDVGLASVDNVRQYSSSNPPPYPVSSVAGRTGAVTLSKSDVGLGNVNNTSDANKPISTATQNALNLKAPLSSPSFTGNILLSGNMTLKGSGNYGNKINFGDGDYVHISEPTDDILELKGNTIKLMTGSTSAVTLSNGNTTFHGAVSGITYPVTSVNGKTGAVTIPTADTSTFAPKNNPTFTGEVYFKNTKIVCASSYQVPSPGENSTSFGYTCWSKGGNSFTAGDNCGAEGDSSCAFGKASGAYGIASHAEGFRSIAKGDYSHAEGQGTGSILDGAYGTCAHSEGYQTKANHYSHSEGYLSAATGAYAHAGGYGTIADAYQYVTGFYNTSFSPGTIGSLTGSAFIIGNGTRFTQSNCFRVQFNGQVFSKGAYSTTGADYAELFEWEDGNPNNEDRRGLFVALKGKKIHIASEKETPIGIISTTAAIIGNNYSESWKGMYLTDIFEEIQTEKKVFPAEYTSTGKEIFPEREVDIPILNPDYDPEKPYIPRHERKEWGIVGLYGQLIVIDDGTCEVNGFCRCTGRGIATKSQKGHLVIERLDDTHIRILSSFINTQPQIDCDETKTLSTVEASTKSCEESGITQKAAITIEERILILEKNMSKLQKELATIKEVK